MTSRGQRTLALAALVTLAALGARTGRVAADPVEPPLGADPDADYVAEPSDSVEAGSVEYGYGITGRSGAGVARRESFEFKGDSLGVALRDGDDEPYGGGGIDARGAGREFRAGRIAPRWGLGLVLGTPREPWSGMGDAAREPWAPRARSGEGASYRWNAAGAEVLWVRVARRDVAGAAARWGRVSLGVAASPEAGAQASLGAQGRAESAEWALDRTGRWSAEAVLSHGRPGSTWLLRARAGHAAWTSLTDPRRFEPSRLATAARAWRAGPLRGRLTLAGWRFAPDTTGTRAAIDAEAAAGGGRLRLGFEEQHGAWRPRSGSRGRPHGMRQGAWLEWRGGTPGLGLVVRHELWGRSPFARQAVRGATGAAVEARLPLGAALTVSHTVYRAHAGETLYLPEQDADRWVLRALAGAGERSRIVLGLPFAGGLAHAEVALQPVRGVTRPRWSLRWSRRVRVRGG